MSEPGDIEVLVIGAGPAGSVAAHQCAAAGASVMLADKAAFPRDKVCGCCVNSAAIGALETAGLNSAVEEIQQYARPVRQLTVYTRHRAATLPLPTTLAISRARFDQALVDAAIAQGARFLPRTSARILPGGAVALRHADGKQTLRPRLAIVADGLAGRALDQHPAFQTTTKHTARIGLAVIVPACDVIPSGQIIMASHARGYVGLVRIENDRLDIAAAIDPGFIREHDNPADAVRAILKHASAPIPSSLTGARFVGTPRLTRQTRPLHAENIFLVGDAAGYVEPFTGEGIAWAITGGTAVAQHVIKRMTSETLLNFDSWPDVHRQLVRRRQFWCRAICASLRHPLVSNAAIAACSHLPQIARPVLRSINDNPLQKAELAS